MHRRMAFRCVAAAALLMAAAAPVWAALEGVIDYSTQTPEVDISTVTGSIDPAAAAAPDCEPVYAPKLVHERDGSIVGMTYELDGDNC
ncbi:hypothetical protein EV561_11888 [Rhizobium sp. BK376]|jgi:hypothetical protein|nr:hypothetical protein EV561_11888 [Rhizobium sp. BK376]